MELVSRQKTYLIALYTFADKVTLKVRKYQLSMSCIIFLN